MTARPPVIAIPGGGNPPGNEDSQYKLMLILILILIHRFSIETSLLDSDLGGFSSSTHGFRKANLL